MNGAELRKQLAQPDRVLRLAGAHNVMGARLACGAGFDGVWVSSFEFATSHGLPDSDLHPWQQLHAAAAAMAAAVARPVVADCQTGFGGPVVVRELVKAYEDCGVAGVCLEDGAFPKRNSLLPGEHAVAPCDEFARKIEAATGARKQLVVLARLQSLIAGQGVAEARDRALAYIAAGADAIVVHSRSPGPEQVLEFIQAWDQTTPLVLIPTTYPAITVQQIRATGKIRMVIYANHGQRAAIAAMQRVFRQILDEGSSLLAENWIAPLEEVFALQARQSGDDSP